MGRSAARPVRSQFDLEMDPNTLGVLGAFGSIMLDPDPPPTLWLRFAQKTQKRPNFITGIKNWELEIISTLNSSKVPPMIAGFEEAAPEVLLTSSDQ